jgi:spore germination protein GerM
VKRLRTSSSVVAIVAALLVAGCGIPVDSNAVVLPNVDVAPIATSTTTVPESSQPTTSASTQRGVIVYYTRSEGLFGRAAVVESAYGAAELLALLTTGLQSDDLARGVRSGLEQRADLVVSTERVDNIMNVELSTSLGELPGAEQVLILGQIALTMLANLPIDGVSFSQNGQVVAVPDANGQPIARPVIRADYVNLLLRS